MKKMKRPRILIFTMLLSLVSIGLSGCSLLGQSFETYDGLQSHVDVSPDDTKILFSYAKDGVASIFTADLDGKHMKQLTHPTDGSHIQPTYSPDGKKIVFLSTTNGISQSLFIMNSDGTDIKPLTKENTLVTEAVFSPDSKKIYFLKAGSFKNYSPIASKAPHDFDIFSINIDGTDLKQITHLKEYQLSGLRVSSDGEYLVLTIPLDVDKLGDAFEAPKGISEEIKLLPLDQPDKMQTINPEMQFEAGVFSQDLSPDDQTIAFTAVPKENCCSNYGAFTYEIFLMDVKSKQAKPLTSIHSSIDYTRFLHRQNKLIFTKNINMEKEDYDTLPPSYELWMIDQDGSNLKQIKLSIPK